MNNLHPIAQAVQSQGRGKDTQLIHMTPNEVQGLQALAMAHGGSLSINPSTGLPEAGFLDTILPAVAGFALGPAGFGVMSSLGAGLTVGGLTALTSGDLGKGISAGLGAWGGSELGSGLSALGGASNTSAAAANVAGGEGALAQQMALKNAASEAATAEVTRGQLLKEGARQALSDPSKAVEAFGGLSGAAKVAGAVGAPMLADQLSKQTTTKMPEKRTPVTVAELEYQRKVRSLKDRDPNDTSEFNYFEGPGYVKTGETTYAAKGGIMGYTQGGSPVSGGRRAIVSNEDYLNQYFSPVQTATQMPDTKKKAGGGTISLAEGGFYGPYGEGYTPMTLEEFAQMYMTPQAAPGPMPGGVSGYEGRRNYTPPTGTQTPSTPGTGGQSDIFVDEDGKKYRLEFDPVTGTYRKIYEAETPAAPAAPGAGDVGAAGGDGESGMPTPGGNNVSSGKSAYSDFLSTPIGKVVARTVNALAPGPSTQPPAPTVNLSTPEGFPYAGVVSRDSAGRMTVTDPNTGSVSYPGGDASPLGNIGGVPPGIGNMVDEGDATGAPEGWAPPGAPNPFAGSTYDVYGVNAPAFETINTRGMTPAQANAQLGIAADAAVAASGDEGQAASVSGDTAGVEGISPGSEGWKDGGLLSLAAGGMSKGGFVVPADVVSALGNGSTAAGLRALKVKLGDVKQIRGKGDGLSDSIPTSIDGRQPARVADGEAYIAPKTVAAVGGGDMKKGAKKLYAMLDNVRKAAHGKTTQQRKVNPAKALKV